MNDRAIQCEMLVPNVTSGIEKSDRVAKTIQGCDVRPFVPIARDTGVGKIANTGRTSVLPANDVIDLVRKASAVLMY